MTINARLDENIPRDVITTRSQSGKNLSYLETWYVIDRLNQVIGNDKWTWEIKAMTLIPGEKISYMCHGSLSIKTKEDSDKYPDYCSKDGIGYGSDKSTFNAGEMASKEAESDALKRAAMKFGRSLGLALYDKSQEYVGESNEQQNAPSESKQREAVPQAVKKLEVKPAVPKVQREQIKTAFGVLQSLKKITKEQFVAEYTAGAKVDDLTDSQVVTILTKIKTNFPELKF